MFGVSAGKTLCRDDFPPQAGCEPLSANTQTASKCPLESGMMMWGPLEAPRFSHLQRNVVYELRKLKIHFKVMSFFRIISQWCEGQKTI